MRTVSGAMAVLAGVLLVVMIGWVLASVVGRFVDGVVVIGSAEVASNGVAAVTLLCVPYVMRSGGHIRTGILVDRLPVRAQRVAWIVACLLGAIVFAVVAWSTWGPMLESWASGEYSGEGSIRIPTGPLRTIVVLFAVCMAVECLLAAHRGPRSSADHDGAAPASDAGPGHGADTVAPAGGHSSRNGSGRTGRREA
ncbi:TRAP transporter small permease [Georgenia sp. Z1491]|uniref:TRAP transporter small permease n=1 Tax=Georgenia sp. Z1491 TaxID=3416707 RepID=UPI003CEA64DA